MQNSSSQIWICSPSRDLRHYRDTAAKAQRDRQEAGKELALEQNRETTLAADIQMRQENIKYLEEQLAAVPYNEALHQKLIGLLPLAQQLEKAEQDHAARTRERAEKSAELEQLEKRLESATQAQMKATQNKALAEEAYATAKEQFAALKGKHGSADMCAHIAAELGELGSLEGQLSRDQDDHASLEKQEKKLAAGIQRLEREEAQAKQAYTAAQEVVEALVRRHSAEELRKHLRQGEPCPVCEQVVGRAPKCPPPGQLDAARCEAKQREETWHNTRDAVFKAKAELAGLPSQRNNLKDRIARTSKRIADLKQKAERMLGKPPGQNAPNELKDLAAKVRGAELDACNKENLARKATEAEAKAKEAVNQLESKRAGVAQQLTSLSQQIQNAAQEVAWLRHELAGAGDVKAIQGFRPG